MTLRLSSGSIRRRVIIISLNVNDIDVEKFFYILFGRNGRGALAENPEVARAVGERDWEGRERPHCLPAILSWNQF